MSKFARKVASVGIAMATVAMLAGPLASAQTLSSSDVASILAQIQALQARLNAAQATAPSTTSFTRNLTVGSKGDDVSALQQILINGGYLKIAAPTAYFGNLTKAALAAWQAASHISPAVGYFGPLSRAALAGAPTTPTTGTGTGTGPVVVPSGTDLVASVAVDSPSAMTIGSGTAFNPALKVKLSAGSKNVSISAITLQKGGFVANTNLNGVDVVDEMGVRYGQVITSINADNTILITFGSSPVVVSAGSSKTLTVRFNLLQGASSGTVQFSLASVSAITADTTAISGSFPLVGATMTIVSGTSALASSTIDVLVSTGSSTLNVDPNSEQEITKFRVKELSSNESLKIYKWMLYNYGNAGQGDYTDVQLVAQDGTVLATAQPMGQYVTFDLSANPYVIDKGLTKDFTVKAKLVGGTTKTIKLVVYNNYDVDFRGGTTNVSILPSAGTNDTSFPIGNQWNVTTIGSGTISLNRSTDSPSNSVTPGSNSIVLAKYDVKPTGENYELRQIIFGISQTTALSGSVVVKVNGAVVYSVGASTFATNGATATLSLSSYPVLTAGQVSVISIEASVPSTATGSDSYTVKSFNLQQAKRLVTNDILSNGDSGLTTSALDGLAIAVKAAKLVVTTLATPVANSVVAGTNGYEYADIQLNSQSGGEDVKVTAITITGTASNLTEISNLVLSTDSTVANALPTTNSTATNAATITFNFTNPVVVARSSPVTLHLLANAVSGSNTHTFYVASSTSAVTATGVTTGNSLTNGSDITFAGSGQTMTHVTAGKLTLSLVSGSGASPSQNQVVSVGTNDGVYFAVKMSSQYETQKITSLKLTASATVAMATTTLTNIRLFDGTTQVASAPQFDSCTAILCTVTFTSSDNLLLNPVPTTGDTLYVKANVAAGGSAILGNDFIFKIAATSTDVAVKGSVTATTTATITGTPAASGVTYVVPQSVVISAVSPTVATQVGTASGQIIGVFKVMNNGTAPIYLSTSTLSFTNGGSASTSLGFKIFASTVGGGQNDTTGWNSGNGYLAAAGTTGASSTVSFATSTFTTAEQKIDGGSWRYLTVKTNGAAANNDTFQLSVSALGNVKFNAVESDLGYDGNGNGNLNDTINGLFVDGLPSIATVTAKT